MNVKIGITAPIKTRKILLIGWNLRNIASFAGRKRCIEKPVKGGKMMAAKKPGKSISKSFRNVVAEMRKVSWPNRKEVTNYTIVVLFTVLVVAVTISIFDSTLSLFFTKVVKLYK